MIEEAGVEVFITQMNDLNMACSLVIVKVAAREVMVMTCFRVNYFSHHAAGSLWGQSPWVTFSVNVMEEEP